MSTTRIYLLVIVLLVYVTQVLHHDDYKQKQQEAQVHREYCAYYPQKCR
jgi:hypothetical protein